MKKTDHKKEVPLKSIEQILSVFMAANSSRKIRKTNISNSEERFALAMGGARDGLWDWNLETDEVHYSARWKNMLGYKDDELANKLSTWAELVHPDDKDVVLTKAQNYLSGGADSFEVEMRMVHKAGHDVYVLSHAYIIKHDTNSQPIRLIGTHYDLTQQKKSELFNKKNTKILKMIAQGTAASKVYDEIALMYEARHPGLRCSMLELEGRKLLHGGAPSLPQAYCKSVNGLINGPDVGSCGASTYTGKRVLTENIETDPKWKDLKQFALPYGMRSCWSEPIKSSTGKVLGAFGMYYNHPALPNEEESNDLTSAAQLASIVMERDQNQKLIRNLAFTDELTKLSNRAHFYLNVEELIKKHSRSKHKFGLLYIDLDNFKNVNDTLGHDIGDLLLIEAAQRLKKACREVDYVARLSGDEFCIVVNGIEDDHNSIHVAQRCLDLMSTIVELPGRKLTPTCSIGIAHYPDDGADLQTLLKAADTALYNAKDLGRNRYAFYSKELTEKAEYRLQIENDLREAINKQQLVLAYQPKIDINTGKIISVEALCRWSHPRFGQIPPVDFIKIAEQIGMINLLSEWVLKTACHQSVSWQNAGFSHIRMAVNVTPSHFLGGDLVPLIKGIIKETSILPSDLELEITEKVVQTNQENLKIFEDLKQLGILLTIDDFGVGYSSFASIKHLGVDFLKIDKYFIDEMLTDHKAMLMIGSMIEMGHILGHKVTAEGIERKEQFNILQKLGCDSVQGHFFSKPVSENEIEKLLNKDFNNRR